MLDLVISGATIVDGTGRPAFTGDVALAGGRIVEVGTCTGARRRTIDAHGTHLLPGFVDIHTHYDGQVTWDPDLSPSSLLGVTTCVMGSCGVGFAPVRPGREAALVELMEGVEDIPGAALAEGIPWGWESFADYMATLETTSRAIDFLVQVPHDPLRMYVMGERAVAGEVATVDEIAEMRALLRAALQAGAAGFSTGRSDNHRTARGAATPASEAGTSEFAGIASAFAGLGHGVIQAVSDFDMMTGPERFDGEFDLLEELAVASGRPLSISTMQRDHAPDQWRRIFARVERAVARGLDLRAQVAGRGIGVLLGLEATFHPFMGFPSYKAIAHLPLAERVARMRDPEVRARMLAETSDKVAGDGTPIPPLADFFLANLARVAMRIYPMSARPDYEPTLQSCLAAEASRADKPVLAHIYDSLLEDEGRALLYFPVYNYSGMNLDVVREMLVHPQALVGLGDAGAHVGTVCDASMPTFLLMHWARDRANGLRLERAVQMQTRDTARFIGLCDRGTIEVGMRADLNVVELSALALHRPVMQRDLPAGGRRLVQRATGYLGTYVGGVAIAEAGELHRRATGPARADGSRVKAAVKRKAKPPELSKGTICTAALALIDRDGLDAFSTRKLGRELGCEAMAIYWYYPSKDALLDAVVDEMMTPVGGVVAKPVGDWIGALREVAHAYRRIAHTHPQAFALLTTRRFASAGTYAFLERLFELAREHGIADRLTARFYRVVSSYCSGFGLNDLAPPRGPAALRRRFPRVDAVSSWLEPQYLDDIFSFGLELQLAALAQATKDKR